MNFFKKVFGKPDAGSSQPEPLELVRAICNEVASNLSAIGNGRRIVPFERLTVHLYAAADEDAMRLEAALIEGNHLKTRIVQRLEQEKCERLAALAIEVKIARDRDPDWPGGNDRAFKLEVGRKTQTAGRTAKLLILTGRATQKSYAIKTNGVTYVGRTESVPDKYGRPVRRNDIVFLDIEDEINGSVGRIQARIEYKPAKDEFRVIDENSKQGTAIVRKGRTIPVDAALGTALKDGDEIYFGKASAEFRI